MERVRSTRGGNCRFICGYEAGCLGYSLYHQLAKHGVACIILAPSTMPQQKGKSIKTDKRDAKNIAKCLAFNLYSPVYVPTAEDDAIKEYIRMRDDVKADLKRTKQQIISFCTRHGFHYEGKSRWTQAYFKWLDSLVFEKRSTRKPYKNTWLSTIRWMRRLLYMMPGLRNWLIRNGMKENVRKLCCFKGVSTHTALPLLVEVGDFHRFRTAQHFSAYLGLVPGESSSGEKVIHTNITKAGNSHLRTLLVESANSYSRGVVGKKSKVMKDKQGGNSPEIIAYADKANERLHRKFYKIAIRSKKNVAKTAIARELSCFVWGMMTNHISRAV